MCFVTEMLWNVKIRGKHGCISFLDNFPQNYRTAFFWFPKTAFFRNKIKCRKYKNTKLLR